MSETEKPKLKPAEENPWYVLATICDKWDKDDEGLTFKQCVLYNHFVWNSWVTSVLDDKEKATISFERKDFFYGLPEWDHIKDLVTELFKKRLPHQELPNPKDTIDFSWIKFTKKVSFEHFLFTEYINFSNSIWLLDALFRESIFLTFVAFENVYFKRGVDFNSAIFLSNHTYFAKTTFDGMADFTNSAFRGKTIFYGIFEGESSFYQCDFNKRINFIGSKFKKYYPMLVGSNLDEKTTLSVSPEDWPEYNNCEQNSLEAKDSCAVLRQAMVLKGLPEQAHFFFRREMHFASKIGSIWQRFPYLLFGWFSDYGNSIKLPTIWLLGLWFFPAMVYWPYLCSGVYTDIFSLEFWNSVARTSALSFGLSLGNLFQFTGLQRIYLIDIIKGLPWGLKFLGGAQTLLAIPLLFLLLLGLRNRFRLK